MSNSNMSPGQYFHIYNRGNNREKIFYEEENYRFFLRQFDKYLSSYVDVLAYCLLPNHFHFFIRIREHEEPVRKKSKTRPEDEINKAFKDFFISYSKSINKKYGRTGSLFQPKFKRKEIISDSYYCSIIIYIHLNPVKAGLCKHCSEWEFSSYNAFVSTKRSRIRVSEIINWFGNVEEFVRVHEACQADTLPMEKEVNFRSH